MGSKFEEKPKISLSSNKPEIKDNKNHIKEFGKNSDEIFLSTIFKNTKNASKIRDNGIWNAQLFGQKPEQKYKFLENSRNMLIMTEKVIKIQAFFSLSIKRKEFKLKLKDYKYRKKIIEELIDTEKIFIEKLKTLVEKIKKPSVIRGLLSKDENKKLFINIDQIILFNDQFLILLEKNFKNYNPKKTGVPKLLENCYNPYTTLIAKDLEKMIPGFLVHTNYWNFFGESQNFLNELRHAKNHPFVTDLLFKVENKEDFYYHRIDDILATPIQRLSKYILLFKDLLKHTSKDHPDYQNIEKSLNLFLNLSLSNNEKLGRYRQNLKMFELEKNFKNDKFKILDSEREFIYEDTMELVNEDGTIGLGNNKYAKSSQRVICYFLSDLILITKKSRKKDQLIDYIALTPNIYVKDIQNSKNFSNLFSIFGEKTCQTFSADSPEQKTKQIKQINDILIKLKKKYRGSITTIAEFEFEKYLKEVSNKLKVNVLGTEERNIENIATRHTFYKIEVNYDSFNFKFGVRYSEMVGLEKQVREKYPKIKITHLSTNSWWNKIKANRLVEERKTKIQSFLNQILINDLIVKEPSFVLKYLNLPLNFYDLASMQKMDFEDKAKELIKETSLIQDSKGKTFNEGIERLPSYVRESYKDPKEISLTEILRKSCPKNLKMKPSKNLVDKDILKVILMNGNFIEVEISQTSRAFEVCEIIATKLGIKSWLDFRLFWGFEANNLIVMEKEEIVYNIKTNSTKNAQKSENQGAINNKGRTEEEYNDKQFFRKNPIIDSCLITDPLKKITSPEKPKQKKKFFDKIQEIFKKDVVIYFKKYVFLPKALEKKEFNADPLRILLLAHQAIQDIRQMKYNLADSDYHYYAGFYLGLKLGKYKELTETQIIEEIKDAIPNFILNMDEQEYLIEEVKNYWKQAEEFLSIGNNEEILKEYEQASKVNESTTKTKSHECIAASLILRSLIPNPLYGVTLFLVQSHRCKELPFQYNFPKSVYLAVDINSVQILHPGSKKALTQITFDVIKSIDSQHDIIIFELITSNLSFHFKTLKSLEIKSLITEYKLLINPFEPILGSD